MNIDNSNIYNLSSTYGSVKNDKSAIELRIKENKEAAEATAAAEKQAAKKPERESSDRVEFSKEATAISKMSAKDRAELVESLKADQENQMNRFMNMMTGIFQKQGITDLTAGSDSFWKTIASGNFKVDAKTKAEAQQAISENGEWGVKQTSQRLFDFAQALAGDDVSKMKQLQDAMHAGFGEAEKAWGGSLPDISYKTREAADKLFEDFYAQAEGKVNDEAIAGTTTVVQQ